MGADNADEGLGLRGAQRAHGPTQGKPSPHHRNHPGMMVSPDISRSPWNLISSRANHLQLHHQRFIAIRPLLIPSSPQLTRTEDCDRASAQQAPPTRAPPRPGVGGPRMSTPEQVFVQVLPLWLGFAVMPNWRGPIAAASTAVRGVVTSCRAHALLTCPSAHGTLATFRGRIRLAQCRACGANDVPVYPLRRGSVAHLYNATMGGRWLPDDSSDEDDDGTDFWLNRLYAARCPGNRLAFMILSYPESNEQPRDVEDVVAWVCSHRRCGGLIQIADIRGNAALQRGHW